MSATVRSQDDGPARPANRHRRVNDADRKRAARACDGCRRQKEKCYGGIPCRRCTRLARPCEFSAPTARDDHLPDGKSSSLNFPGSGPQEVSELMQRMASMERLLVHYVGNISLDSETLNNLAESVDKGDPIDPSLAHISGPRASTSRPHGSGDQQRLPRDDDDGSENSSSEDYPQADITVQPLENNAAHYSGEFSLWNFSMRIKNWIDQCVPPQDANTPTIKEFYRADDLPPSSDTLSLLSSLPPRYVTDFLVRVFYRHVVTNYFFVDKAWLASKLDQLYSNPTHLNRRDIPSLCILLMILAIGTQYAYLESRAMRRPGDPPPMPGADSSPFSEDSVGVMFYQQASRLVADVITIASLESVQACALIGLYTISLDPSGLSYVYWNLALRLAIQNGMHRKYPGKSLDPAVQETRNRVWWTVYTFERRIGIFHGRPAAISRAEIDVELPVERPEGRLGPLTAHQLAILELNRVLESATQPISLFKTNQKQNTIDALATLSDIKNKLHAWWDNLPDAVAATSPQAPASMPAPISRAAQHLRLEYCSVRMFAGRIFITPREPTRSNPSPSSAGMDTGSSSHRRPGFSTNAQRRAALVNDCVEAAKTVIETCRLLHGTIGLARASYTEYGSCRAALLVLIAQCLQQPSEELREALREGLSMLKEMSAAGDSARFDVALLEAFESGVTRLCAATSTSSPPEADYEGFKKWEMLWQSEALQHDPRIETGLEAAFGFPSRAGSSSSGHMGVHPAAAWGGAGGGLERQPMAALSSGGPFIGMDGSLSSMPIFDDLSAMFGGGYGPTMDSTMDGSHDGNSWTGM